MRASGRRTMEELLVKLRELPAEVEEVGFEYEYGSGGRGGEQDTH